MQHMPKTKRHICILTITAMPRVKMKPTWHDNIMTAIRPRSGEPEDIQAMNDKLLACHPAFHQERKADHRLSLAILEREDGSIAELFRRIINQP